MFIYVCARVGGMWACVSVHEPWCIQRSEDNSQGSVLCFSRGQFQGLNWGHQPWQQESLPAGPSHQPILFFEVELSDTFNFLSFWQIHAYIQCTVIISTHCPSPSTPADPFSFLTLPLLLSCLYFFLINALRSVFHSWIQPLRETPSHVHHETKPQFSQRS